MAFIKKEYSDGFFNVSKQNGFLPQSIPLEKLPQDYSQLQNILDTYVLNTKVPNNDFVICDNTIFTLSGPFCDTLIVSGMRANINA